MVVKLLITGGCGFIGSNFINYIFDEDKYEIVNIDAMYYCASEKNVDEKIRKSDKYHMVKGNVCSDDIVN